jgi:hypothetical protein
MGVSLTFGASVRNNVFIVKSDIFHEH